MDRSTPRHQEFNPRDVTAVLSCRSKTKMSEIRHKSYSVPRLKGGCDSRTVQTARRHSLTLRTILKSQLDIPTSGPSSCDNGRTLRLAFRSEVERWCRIKSLVTFLHGSVRRSRGCQAQTLSSLITTSLVTFLQRLSYVWRVGQSLSLRILTS